MQDGEPNLAGTARPAVLRLSPATAAEIGSATGDSVRISTGHGRIVLPLEITEMPDRVAWLPWNSAESTVNDRLTTALGHRVRIQREDPHE
jgi:NADH-quinone oxidoreductase subunit G